MDPQLDQSYQPSLSQHISNTTSSKKRFELDIDSHDNKRLDGGSTWASKDWCVDAINSRKLLRERPPPPHYLTSRSTGTDAIQHAIQPPGSLHHKDVTTKWETCTHARTSNTEAPKGPHRPTHFDT